MREQLYKFLSLSLSFTILTTSFTGSAQAALVPGMSQLPDFVHTLTPPARLGFMDSYYQGETKNPVVLIQDLHANYGVQKKIMGILAHLQPRIAQGGRSMVIGVEGAWGDVDVSAIRNEEMEVRKAAGEFLLKEAEITGMEQFAAESGEPVRVVGIDNPDDYLIHQELFRKSLDARMKLARKVNLLRKVITSQKETAPRSIRRISKIEEAYQKGEIDLTGLAQTLGVPKISHYGEAEAVLYQKKLEAAQNDGGKSAFFLTNLMKADHDLALLSRLFRQHLTLEEVQFVYKKLPETLSIVHRLLPNENMEEWSEVIRAAVDYYAVALMRDKPMAEHARGLVENNPDASVVVVTGGFHTAGIARYFRERKMSYVALTPTVESHTLHDEWLYLERIMGEHVSDGDIAYAVRQWAAAQTLNYMRNTRVWQAAATRFATIQATLAARRAAGEQRLVQEKKTVLLAVRNFFKAVGAFLVRKPQTMNTLMPLKMDSNLPNIKKMTSGELDKFLNDKILVNNEVIQNLSKKDLKEIYQRLPSYETSETTEGMVQIYYWDASMPGDTKIGFSEALSAIIDDGKAYALWKDEDPRGTIALIPQDASTEVEIKFYVDTQGKLTYYGLDYAGKVTRSGAKQTAQAIMEQMDRARRQLGKEFPDLQAALLDQWKTDHFTVRVRISDAMEETDPNRKGEALADLHRNLFRRDEKGQLRNENQLFVAVAKMFVNLLDKKEGEAIGGKAEEGRTLGIAIPAIIREIGLLAFEASLITSGVKSTGMILYRLLQRFVPGFIRHSGDKERQAQWLEKGLFGFRIIDIIDWLFVRQVRKKFPKFATFTPSHAVVPIYRLLMPLAEVSPNPIPSREGVFTKMSGYLSSVIPASVKRFWNDKGGSGENSYRAAMAIIAAA